MYYSRRIAGADFSLQMLRQLFPLMRWADVVHLTATYSFPTIPTLFACKALQKPLVWSPRGALLATHEWQGARNRHLKRIWERVCGFMLRRTFSVLHVTSSEEKAASLARVPVRGAKVIRNGVEVPARLNARTWTPEGRLRLLFLGRLDPKKGIENLLEAVAMLGDPSVTLEVCGAGDPAYSAHLTRLVSALGISNGVRFSGHVDGEEKAAAFARADLCVAPSHSENFCMVVAESLAHGVPVIASTGTPWSKVVERECGEWIPNTPESLAQGIRRTRGRELERMGNRGRAWMQEQFSWDAVAKEMQNLYSDLIHETRS